MACGRAVIRPDSCQRDKTGKPRDFVIGPQRGDQHDGEQSLPSQFEEMHTYFRKAEQMSGQPEEQIDTGLLDVPEVDVQHLPPLQCTSTEQKESLIAGERVRKMNAAKDSHND